MVYFRLLIFLSTPSARRATDLLLLRLLVPIISIHALREEGDFKETLTAVGSVAFLSTPSARRATTPTGNGEDIRKFLSTPSARRATDDLRAGQGPRSISIHALREEGDGSPVPCRSRRSYFYPRPPRGGRPQHDPAKWELFKISIHALREEGDLIQQLDDIRAVEFLSTPSARRATQQFYPG